MTCLVILLIQLGLNDTAINGIDDQILQDKHHDTPALNFNTIHMNAELAILIHTVIPPENRQAKFHSKIFSSNFWRENFL